jgi:hypothetical protein
MEMIVLRLIQAFVGIALPLFVLGCSQEGRGVASPSGSDSKQTETDESKEAWVYNSKADGFSLTLPSSKWKQIAKKKHIADFWSNQFGSPMLAGVFSIKQQTKAGFQDLVKDFKEEIKKKDDLLVKPTIQDGVNNAGNPFVFVILYEKGEGEEEYFFVGKSYTWIKDKAVTVEVLFEGQAKMKSKVFKAIENKEFEKAAKTICVAVQAADSSLGTGSPSGG